MKALLLLIGIVALLAGLLFAGQGAGIVNWPEQSFMVQRSQWVFYGLVIAALGLVLIALAARRPRR